MSTKANQGKPVIDELRLCYIAEPSLLEDLSKVEVGGSWIASPFTLFRLGGDRFEFTFAVCIGEPGKREEIGMLKFGRYGAGKSPYVYYKINNRVLYSPPELELAMSLPDLLGLLFNNFTAIDIAIDFQKNISTIIKRMMRNENVTTILNGKAQKDRKRIIHDMTVDYSTSLNRLHHPTITLRQEKARKHKDKGITVQSYDKKAEIEAVSGKDYILEYYGQPRFLFRLEVRLRYQELQDFCKRAKLIQSAELVFDPAFLLGAFYYHLSAVLRFTKGRRPLAWEDIIACNGRV